jgi:hemolysin III
MDLSDKLFFPDYSRLERITDAVVHCIGVPLGLAAAALLVVRGMGLGPLGLFVVAVYAAGLVGMLTASALYQLCPKGVVKERLRRLDRAMIFVMIAGTYTPISVMVLYRGFGVQLCLLLWALAAVGIFMTLRYPRRFERAMLGLYLGMGWMLLVLIHYAFTLLAPNVGAVIQTTRLKFHNPVWHTLILVAAALQYAAISLQLTGAVI